MARAREILPGAGTAGAPGAARSLTAGAVIAGFLCLFATNLDIYLSVRGVYHFSGILLFLAGVAAVVVALAAEGRARAASDAVALAVAEAALPLSLFAAWVALHAMNIGRTVVTEDSEISVALPIYQFAVLAVGLALGAVLGGTRRLRAAAALVVLVLGASIAAETVVAAMRDGEALRAGGFALNPNVAAFVLGLALCLALDFECDRKTDLALLGFAAVAMTITLSRMGLAYLALIGASYVAMTGWRQMLSGRLGRMLLLMAGLLVLAGALGALLVLLAQTNFSHNLEVMDRIEGLLSGSASLASDPYRGHLASHYTAVALETPFLGYGPGYTLSIAKNAAPYYLGPHNMILREWIDLGVPGAVIYAAFVVSLPALGLRLRSAPLTLIGVLVVAYSFFSHNLIDSKPTLILVGVALGQAVRTGKGGHARSSRH